MSAYQTEEEPPVYAVPRTPGTEGEALGWIEEIQSKVRTALRPGNREMLKLFAGHLRLLEVEECSPVIYFLVKDSTVTYIGQTTNYVGRIAKHRETRDFDKVYVLPTQKEFLSDVERTLINVFNPPENKQVPSGGRTSDDQVLNALLGPPPPGELWTDRLWTVRDEILFEPDRALLGKALDL